MSRTGLIGAIVVIVLIIIAAFFFMNPKSAATNNAADTTVPAQTGGDQTAPTADTVPQQTGGQLSGTVTASTGKAPMSATVNYDGSKYTPSTVTIAKGGTVTFTSSVPMWLASNPHPAHTGYDGTSRSTHCAPNYTGAKPFDECARGTSFSFTFDKTGTFGYHDHMNEDAQGTVVVQ